MVLLMRRSSGALNLVQTGYRGLPGIALDFVGNLDYYVASKNCMFR